MKIASAALLALAIPACESSAPADRFAVAVAPLELTTIDDVCYGLTVRTATDTVWSKSGLCASRYGDGTSALTYIGTCDADAGQHEVQLVLESIVAGGETLDDQLSGNPPDFNNPCPAPAGCVLPATCEENADTLVEFNLTVLRRAEQGFFDIAVNFDDVFCSAKADCADDDGPIALLHNPRTDGERDQTLVLGLTCAGGADADTQLHWLDAAIVCGATRYDLLAALSSGEQGLQGPIGGPDSLVFEHAYYFGEQALAPYLGLYSNIAVGLDTRWLGNAAHTSCRLEASATVSDGPLEDGHTPAATRYPMVTWSIALNEGSQLVCTQHPLDGGNGLATDYTAIDTEGAPVRFTLDGDGDGAVTVVDLADQVPNDPGPIASPEMFITSDGILRLAYLVDRQADRLYRFFLVDGDGRAIGRSSAGFSIGQREGSYAITGSPTAATARCPRARARPTTSSSRPSRAATSASASTPTRPTNTSATSPRRPSAPRRPRS